MPLASSLRPPVPPIVGMVGKKRSGKDTFAARLVSDHGFERLAFADPLKRSLLTNDPWVSIEDDERGPLREAGWDGPIGPFERLSVLVRRVGMDAAKETREVRRLLQTHGEGVRLHVDLDVWLRPVVEKAKRLPYPVVVTDVRYRNEADAIEAAGGILVRVTRPGVGLGDLHASEVDLDDRIVGWTVANLGTIADLHAAADELAEYLSRR